MGCRLLGKKTPVLGKNISGWMSFAPTQPLFMKKFKETSKLAQ